MVIYAFTRLDYNEYHDGNLYFYQTWVILILIKSDKSINSRRDAHYNQVW
jgi:hypothetical protein